MDKTSNEVEIERIAKFTVIELLTYCMENPEYLSDGYYRVLGSAMEERYQILTKEIP